MSEIRYALYSKGENIYKDNRTFKSKYHTLKKLMHWREWEYLSDTKIDIVIKEIEVESVKDQLQSKDETIKILKEA
ncbi:MAG TPA: hypothetical protein VFW58_11390 [Trichococcus sp.]|nr:hypothetical protein [Trichococcus sp.]